MFSGGTSSVRHFIWDGTKLSHAAAMGHSILMHATGYVVLSGLCICRHDHDGERCMHFISGMAVVMVAAMNMAASCAETVNSQMEKGDEAYAHAQQLVDIGNGRKMNLYCIGAGSPTVVFDSGLSDWGFAWALVHPRIARLTRACVYDRAGLGYSEPSHRPGTSANMVEDLHRLLLAASIKPPYVLVGHSLGGLNVRLYADRYLHEVAGMVLVDPIHEDGMMRIDALTHGQETARYAPYAKIWRACAAAASKGYAHGSVLREKCVDAPLPQYSAALNAARQEVEMSPAFQNAQLSEAENFLNGKSFAEVRTARRQYGTMPLVVLTSADRLKVTGEEWRVLHIELAQ
ncbi:MAG: alpha/beta fold hydrolase, partial [Burkholderiaceae bacterium]